MFRLALHWQILIAMVLGAAIGLALNVGASRRQTKVILPARDLTASIVDTTDRIEIRITETDTGETRTAVVDPTGQTPGAPTTLTDLKNKDPLAYELFQAYGRSPARRIGDVAQVAGGLFLRLLKMVAIPLIITSLLSGVTGLGSAARLGKMFGRTLLYYLGTSMLAIITGLVLVNVIHPGLRPGGMQITGEAEPIGQDLGSVLFEQLQTLIPENPIAAAAQAEFLSIISFTLLFGIFTILAGGRALELVSELAQAGFEVMMKMTMAIIRLAPLGVLFLMLYATATQGIDVFRSLAWYMLTVLLALGVHTFITLPLIVWLLARRNPLAYLKAVSPALLTAFSSASSNATLPLTMASVEQRAGISNRVSSFVLPLGATVNMDGTALYEAVAVLFIAQMTHGDLTFAQQVTVAVTALLASIGAAGIPHAGLVMMVIILQAVGLPTESQGLILAVDRVLDMSRTVTNVWSDACGCAVIARYDPAEEPAA